MKYLQITRLLAAVLGLIALAQTTLADEKIYNQTLRSTAWVLAKTGDGTSSGTGVLVDADRKLLVTNFHVVGEARGTVIFFPDTSGSQVINDRDHYLRNVRRLGVRGQVVGLSFSEPRP